MRLGGLSGPEADWQLLTGGQQLLPFLTEDRRNPTAAECIRARPNGIWGSQRIARGSMANVDVWHVCLAAGHDRTGVIH